MWQDTWTFRLDDAERGRALAARGAARRSTGGSSRCWRRPGCPDVPLLRRGRAPGRHACCCCTPPAWPTPTTRRSRCSRRCGDVPARSVASSATCTGPTTSPRRTSRRPAQNPEGHRYAVDCAWTDAPADVLAPLLLDIWRELDTEHSFSIWYGWAPDRDAARHGVLRRGQRLRRDLPRSTPTRPTTSATATWVHERTAAIARDGGVGVYLGDTDFTRRQDRFLSDEHFAPARGDPRDARPGRPLRVVPRPPTRRG